MAKLVTFNAPVTLTYGFTVPSTKSGRAPVTGNGEKLAGQEDALDLVGALVDLRDPDVAHHPQARATSSITIATARAPAPWPP